MTRVKRSRPAANGAATSGGDETSKLMLRVSDPGPYAGLTLEQSRVIQRWIADGNGLPASQIAFVAVITTTGDHYRRRAYFNLPSAQKARARAEARGDAASIVLCRLVPVDGGL